MFNPQKYQPYPPVVIKRTWPDKTITKSPRWCSVDLRDGNQALPQPMNVAKKTEYFTMLTEIGFKEIEVGFPAPSQTDFDFVRLLIDEQRIPADVTIQVLTQAREGLIGRTLESLRGARQTIVHLYNSTNPAQRRIVFGMSRDQVRDLAVKGTKCVQEAATTIPQTDVGRLGAWFHNTLRGDARSLLQSGAQQTLRGTAPPDNERRWSRHRKGRCCRSDHCERA